MALLSAITKAVDELVQLGYPREVAERIASGDLPMDTASRMQRAEAMGFGPSDVQYHGTKADFTEFAPSDFGNVGPGIYMSSNPEVASGYASRTLYNPEEGAQVMPLITRGDTIGMRDYFAQYPDTAISQMPDTNAELRELGITAINEAAGAPDKAVFDPRDVRSLFSAAFDPEYKGSNILGGAATAAVGAGLLAAPEEAEAGVLGNLIKAGYPEEVAQRIASGELPMDYDSRMERARSQDHDIHEGLLHGSTHDITNFDASLTQQQNDLGQGIYLTDRPFDVNTNYAGEGPDLTNRIERLADELESTMESSWSWNADFWDKLPGGPQGKLADEIESLIEEGEYRAAAEKASKALSKGDSEGVVYPLTVSKAGMADSADSVPMPEYFDEAVEDLEFDANNLTDEQYDEVMDRVYELEADDIESPIAKAINIAAQYGADFPAYNIEPGMTTFADMHRYFQMTEAYDDAGEVVGGGQMMNEWLRDLGYTGYVDRTTPEKFSGMGAGVHTIVFPGEEKNIRSFLSAAYDPKYTGPNILGGSAAAATGLGLLGMPQESVADTAARLRAESDTSGAYAPRSGLLQDVTMAARDLERRLEGSPASLLFPSGYIQHLEEFNRPYERSTYMGALLGALDFL